MFNQKPEAIFIVGNSRSGTTLMSKILDKHPDVFAFKEIHFYERLWTPTEWTKLIKLDDAVTLGAKLLCFQRERQQNPKYVSAFQEEAMRMLSNTGLNSFDAPTVYREFLLYETKKQGKQVPCEQTPRYVFYLSEILQQFQRARIINMVRDPRDVLLSQKNKWKQKEVPYKERLRRWTNYHPLLLSKMWHTAQKTAEEFANNPYVLRVRFEDLLREPETTVREICRFLGLEFIPAMLEVSASMSPSREPEECNNSQKGISTKPIGRWMKRLGKVDVYWCEHINGEMMRLYGYETGSVRPSWFEIGRNLFALPIKSILAVILNLGNTRNLVASVKRRFL